MLPSRVRLELGTLAIKRWSHAPQNLLFRGLTSGWSLSSYPRRGMLRKVMTAHVFKRILTHKRKRKNTFHWGKSKYISLDTNNSKLFASVGGHVVKQSHKCKAEIMPANIFNEHNLARYFVVCASSDGRLKRKKFLYLRYFRNYLVE